VLGGLLMAAAPGIVLTAADIWPSRLAAAVGQVAGKFLTPPLVNDIYTADPSAHVFNGRLFIYPSHDIDAGVKPDDLGSHFAMRDYHVFSMDAVEAGKIVDHGVALDIADVPWAGRQMWAPDAAEQGGRYYLYFPAKDKEDVFRIGVAVGSAPQGPFKAQPQPMAGTYSIDPCVFRDSDGQYYMYFGGIWGGQLQRWASGSYVAKDVYPAKDQPAISAKVARLGGDMVALAEAPRDIVLQDETGKPLVAGDNARRFFEAAWLHKYNGTYYFSYSTGDTHNIMYATGRSPYGPFTVRGKILEPVLGWTSHHSIVEFKGKWYLFYHDAQRSGGQTHLRNIKVTELKYRTDGSIETIDAYVE
jgi:beta-xylosidase